MTTITPIYRLNVADIEKMRKSEKAKNNFKANLAGVSLAVGAAATSVGFNHSPKLIQGLKEFCLKRDYNLNLINKALDSYMGKNIIKNTIKDQVSKALKFVANNPKFSVFAMSLLAAFEANHFISNHFSHENGKIDQKYDSMLA